MQSYLIRRAIAVVWVVMGVCQFACAPADRKQVGPAEKITLAYFDTTPTALVQVAQARGYYGEEGLEAALRLHPYGKPALADVLAGQADFATVAETPVMFAVMNGKKIAIVATIQTSSKGNAIVARRDNGILALPDLKGKKIAVTLGTISDFFVDAMLATHGISRKDVTVVDLKAEEIPAALANGAVDAASTFTPYITYAQQKLGHCGITFFNEDIYTQTFNVVATREFIHNNPGKVRKLLRALVKAEEFVNRNPAEAQRTVADFSGMDVDLVRALWADNSFGVSLDQPLLLALEDESRWAMRSGLTDQANSPNYLDFIYLDGLQAVKPAAVRILQ